MNGIAGETIGQDKFPELLEPADQITTMKTNYGLGICQMSIM